MAIRGTPLDFTYSFGYWILRRRKALDLTRVELARRVNCAPETIKKIERDERRPSLQIAALLADVLAIPSGERELFLEVARGQRSVDRIPLASLPLQAPHQIQPFLAPQFTHFVGREAELVAIANLLANPDCRLLTLAGPGGIGKSRLAFKAAEQFASAYAHGVYVDALAGVASAQVLLASILAALGLELYGKVDPQEQLFAYLKERQVLLVLDNFEHLLEGTDLLVSLLHNAPRVTLLVTSRERLNLQSEWVFPLEGLPYPILDSTGDTESFAAVALFTQTARRLKPAFTLDETNRQDVARICRLVEGMPLAVELAAAWIPVLEPEEIAREIEHSLDILEADLRDLPLRQRSLRAVFYASWELLSPPEQEAVQRLSVFRGGFSRKAAEISVGIDIQGLLVLVNKCWLQMESGGRFRIHELIRQYAFEQLRQDRKLWFSAGENHSAYYCRLLKDHEKDWHHKGEMEAYSELKAEFQNIDAAWKWALDQGRLDLLSLALESLCNFYNWSGQMRDGEAACQDVAQLLKGLSPLGYLKDADALLFQTRALTWQGNFSLDYQDAVRFFEEARGNLDQLEQSGHDIRQEKAQLLWFKGSLSIWSDPKGASQILSQCQALLEALGDEVLQSEVIIILGLIAYIGGDLEKALDLSQKSLASIRKAGYQGGMVRGLDMLAKIHREKGQLEDAENCNRQVLALNREMGMRISEGECLANLAHTLTCAGRYSESEFHARESLNIFNLISSLNSYTTCTLARALLHQGLYTEARSWAARSLEEAVNSNDDLTFSLALNYLGEVDLVENRLSESRKRLWESLKDSQSRRQIIKKGMPLADLAYTHRALGQAKKARACLHECLEDASRIGSFRLAIHALPALALLEADQGQSELAIELYALACQYPYIANSRWFEDIAGREIAHLEAALPVEAITAAYKRGRSLDFWEAIKEGVRKLQPSNVQTF